MKVSWEMHNILLSAADTIAMTESGYEVIAVPLTEIGKDILDQIDIFKADKDPIYLVMMDDGDGLTGAVLTSQVIATPRDALTVWRGGFSPDEMPEIWHILWEENEN